MSEMTFVLKAVSTLLVTLKKAPTSNGKFIQEAGKRALLPSRASHNVPATKTIVNFATTVSPLENYSWMFEHFVSNCEIMYVLKSA